MRKDIKDSLMRIMRARIEDNDEQVGQYWLHQLHQNDHTNYSQQDLDQISDEMWAKLHLGENKKPTLLSIWPRVGIAASVITILFFIGYSYFHSRTLDQAIVYNSDVNPGSSGATLTLADGKKIKLSGTHNGKVFDQSGIIIRKTYDGQLIYQADNVENGGINTLSTGNGETYQVVLSDGTKVWLNAGSMLSYSPKLIVDNKRMVTLQGEAYMEVAKDANHPFLVSSSGQTVQVLGTHFNIKAYPDESSIQTTLLEGSIKLKMQNQEAVLVPGQQARLKESLLKITNVPTDDAIAWKNGEFVFQDSELSYIMQQLSRWYNIEVIYENQQVKQEKFSGTFSRFGKVSEALKVMERTGLVHFGIEGKTIKVN